VAHRRKSPRSTEPRREPAAGADRFAYGRFLLHLLLAVVPVALVWVALTPVLDNFLRIGGEAFVQLTEVPNVTELLPAAADPHYAVIHRRDFPPARANVTTFRVTDVHFHLVLLGVLFLAVPGVPWRRRLLRLGQAALILLAFDVVLVLLWVKFTYATQLGDWSVEHYGPFARNAWGLAKHVADLPIKLALPFALWAGFYLGLLLPRRDGAGEP
jgi:hypothetical protein